MEKLICADSKGYNLTEGKEYEIVKSEKNFIFIENDNGKAARYLKELFKDIIVEPEPIPVPVRTEQDCINSIEVINSNRLKYRNLNNEEIFLNFNYLFSELGNDFSCGIRKITGINDAIRNIIEVLEEDIESSGEDLIDLQKELFKKSLRNYLNSCTGEFAMFLLSTNITGNDEDLISVLDEISHFKTDPVLNPNSNNQIKMWGFYKNQL